MKIETLIKQLQTIKQNHPNLTNNDEILKIFEIFQLVKINENLGAIKNKR